MASCDGEVVIKSEIATLPTGYVAIQLSEYRLLVADVTEYKHKLDCLLLKALNDYKEGVRKGYGDSIDCKVIFEILGEPLPVLEA